MLNIASKADMRCVFLTEKLITGMNNKNKINTGMRHSFMTPTKGVVNCSKLVIYNENGLNKKIFNSKIAIIIIAVEFLLR